MLAQVVVDDMVAEQARLSRDRIGITREHFRQIGTESDWAAQTARIRLQPLPPHPRNSTPSPPSPPPQGSRVVSSWASVTPPGNVPFLKSLILCLCGSPRHLQDRHHLAVS